MTTETLQTRFDYPHPTVEQKSLMVRIVELMLDGQRRSKKEICSALGIDGGTEIGARIRDARRAEHGAWPFDTYVTRDFNDTLVFNDSRTDGPDEDGIYRWQIRKRVTP